MNYTGGLGPAGLGKPGIVPLRPLVLAEILGGAVAVIRRHPALILGVSFAVVAISQAIGFGVTVALFDGPPVASEVPATLTPEQAMAELGELLRVSAAPALINVLSQTFLAGFLTVIVGRAVLGRPVSLAEVLAELRPRLLPLLLLTLLYTVLVGVGLMLFVVPGIWLGVLFSLATPALVLERGTIGASLSRSRALLVGSWWQAFGVLLVGFALSTLVGMVIQMPFDAMAFSPGADPTTGGMAVSVLGATIAGALTQPFTSAVIALLYLDQRMRKENMHHELARIAGTSGA